MKIAAKLLTQSDLTLFASYYRVHGTSKQKGVNLNGSIIADSFFPALPKSLASAEEVPITLDIFGPGEAGQQRLRRKIVKSVGGKNWRLNGKLVEESADEKGRYSQLKAGDVAIFAFSGDVVPDNIIMIILDQGGQNKKIRDTVVRDLSLAPGSQSMAVVTESQIKKLTAIVANNHPINILLPDQDRLVYLERSFLGDLDAKSRLLTKTRLKHSRTVSVDELAMAQKRAIDIGRAGEVLIDELLSARRDAGLIADYTWNADMDALAPFDFTIVTPQGITERIDVKSTTGPFDGQFYISQSELRTASAGYDPYFIYRVYGMDTNEGPKLKRSHNIHALASSILSELSTLMDGVTVSSVQVSPGLLDWGDEEILMALEQEG